MEHNGHSRRCIVAEEDDKIENNANSEDNNTATPKKTTDKKKAKQVETKSECVYLVGVRIAYRFLDDNWYRGTVVRVPWRPRHKWAHWRRVQFDRGVRGIKDVDTAHDCAHYDGRVAMEEAREFVEEAEDEAVASSADEVVEAGRRRVSS